MVWTVAGKRLEEDLCCRRSDRQSSFDNGVAMVNAGGVGSIPSHLKNSDLVFVLDNEPRNRQIANLMERLLEIGHKVCIWPRSNGFKDVNDMILGGMTKRKSKGRSMKTHIRD